MTPKSYTVTVMRPQVSPVFSAAHARSSGLTGSYLLTQQARLALPGSLPTATPTLSHQVPAIPIVRPHNALASWPPGLSPHDGWPFCLCRVFSVALTAKPWQCLVEIYVHLPQILCSASLFPQRAYFYLFIPQTSSLVPPVGFLVGTEN